MTQRGTKKTEDSSDAIVQTMKKYNIPLTREEYLNTAYPDGIPEMTAELESMLPEEIQKNS